jgi:hypothetical protein
LGHLRTPRRTAALLTLAGSLVSCTTPPPAEVDPVPPFVGIEEPSGVTRSGDELLIVGDHEPGTYYSASLPPEPGDRVALDADHLTRHVIAAGQYAMDLEGIDVLADGRIVVLSERMSALLDEDGLVAVYGVGLAELGGRGTEGLAVRALESGWSRVAILWEGGYPNPGAIQRDAKASLAGQALRPRVIVHDIAPGESGIELDPEEARVDVDLQVPVPAGVEPTAQRFRAPDLVWHRLGEASDEWGFIVLMSSGYEVQATPGPVEQCPKSIHDHPLRWCYKWLQRFRQDGTPLGEPYDLDPALPAALRNENWEGLGWYEEGRRLVLVYDEKVAQRKVVPQVAVVVDLPKGW